jgi:CubicO group peptidase (beta-lactamase class C family)
MIVRFLKYFILILISVSCSQTSEQTDNVKTENTIISDAKLNQLTSKQQFNQHLVVELPNNLQQNIDSVAHWIANTQIGGVIVSSWNIDSVQKLHKSLDTLVDIQPFFIDNFWQRIQSKPYSYQQANNDLKDEKLLKVFNQSGINLIEGIKKTDSVIADEFYTISSHFPKNNKNEYLKFVNTLNKSKQFVQLDVPLIDSIDYFALKNRYNFKGLFISEPKNSKQAIEMGADLILINSIDEVNQNQLILTSITTKSTKQILEFKHQLFKKPPTKSASSLLKYLQLNYQQKGTVLLNNNKNIIPSTKVYKQTLNQFNKNELQKITKKRGVKYILLPDTLTKTELSIFTTIKPKDELLICFSNIDYYQTLKVCPQLIFVPPLFQINQIILEEQLKGNLSFEGDFIYNNQFIKGKKIISNQLSRTPPEFVGVDSKILKNVNYIVNNAMNGRAFPGCQVLVAKKGSIIFDKTYGYHSYKKEISTKQNSVYDIASLTKIISTTLIGMTLYEQGMYQLNDSIEQYFPDSLKRYLNSPSTIRNITFKELFIHKSGLPAGFPILKYMQYTSDEVRRFDKYFCDMKDSVFNIEVAENFYMDKSYQDSMWLEFHKIWIDDSKPYKYSDVNMNLLYFLFKSIITNNRKKFGFKGNKKKWDNKNLYVEYLYNTFYRPLNMNSTYYQPLKHINKNRIVPTENESYWRKQLLQGYVHDPNSALHGGVAGNAGIFTTSNDMIKLLQMWLNGGIYAQKRYLKQETIDLFTSTQQESHRGLGFNKRAIDNSAYAMADSASINTYGHTGFTGTCFWIDPDNELIYIFLSNRVNPKVNKRIYQYALRKNVHQVFYNADMISNN